MKKIFFTLFFLQIYFFSHSQEYRVLLTKDDVKVEYKFNNDTKILSIRMTNSRNEKVFANIENILWFDGVIQVGKQNGGSISLQPKESSAFGLFWPYPAFYKPGNTFKLDDFKVHIGGLGKDPRYNSSSTTSGTNNSSSAPLREIVFPGDDPKSEKPATSNKDQTNTQKINNTDPNNSAKVDNNVKLNGLYYSNGTANPNNTTSNNTVNTDQKQKYQNDANDYLIKAQDNNQSAISKQLNLDLAKTNAIMGGNTQQLQQIQHKQNQNIQRTDPTLSFMNMLGDLLIQSSKRDSKQMLDNMSNQRKEKWKMRSSVIALRDEKFHSALEFSHSADKYKEAITSWQEYLYFDVLDSYNGFHVNHWIYKKDIEAKGGITKGYLLFKYLKFNNSDDKLTFSDLSIEKFILPDLFHIPICRAFTDEPVRKDIYEEAFSNLGDPKKCQRLDLVDGFYEIECKKKKFKPYNEDSALSQFRKIIFNPEIENAVDILDYSSSALWYNCLQSKKTKTINDLLDGIRSCIKFYAVSNTWASDLKSFDYIENNYIELSEKIINYYFIDYYQQLANTLNDNTFLKWSKERVNLIAESNFSREKVINQLASMEMFPDKWFDVQTVSSNPKPAD